MCIKFQVNRSVCAALTGSTLSTTLKVYHNPKDQVEYRQKKRKLAMERLLSWATSFGSIGNSSGGGIWQFSPLIYILLGKPHPLLSVNEVGSFCRSIHGAQLMFISLQEFGVVEFFSPEKGYAFWDTSN